MSTSPPTQRAYSTYQPNYVGSGQVFVNGNPWIDILPTGFLIQNYLAGLPLQATANGANLQAIAQQKIDAAIGRAETLLGSFLVPRQIISAVMGSTPQKVISVSPGGYANMGPAAEPGVDYDLLEVPYDYTSRRFEKWSLIRTRHRPITSMASVLYALPPSFGILVVPQPWIVPDPNTGIIRIVPVEGAMDVTSPGAGMWLPFFTMGSMDHVPQFSQASYTAGISPVPADMVDAVAALAAALVLEQYSAAYYPGVQAFTNSGGGFSQSVTLRQKGGPFGEQIERYERRAVEYFNAWRQSHSGVRMASLGR